MKSPELNLSPPCPFFTPSSIHLSYTLNFHLFFTKTYCYLKKHNKITSNPTVPPLPWTRLRIRKWICNRKRVNPHCHTRRIPLIGVWKNSREFVVWNTWGEDYQNIKQIFIWHTSLRKIDRWRSAVFYLRFKETQHCCWVWEIKGNAGVKSEENLIAITRYTAIKGQTSLS